MINMFNDPSSLIFCTESANEWEFGNSKADLVKNIANLESNKCQKKSFNSTLENYKIEAELELLRKKMKNENERSSEP